VGLLILDELREHRDWAAWASLTKTTIAQLNALTVLISNAGEDRSVVLNATRESALAAMDDPDADDSIALMEWSAPDGCDLDDEEALACACPTLNLPGSGFTTRVAAGMRAVEPPGVYRTEVLCQRVSALDPPLDPVAWANCVDHSGSLVTVREQVCVVVDVAEGGGHAVLAGAACWATGGSGRDDGRVERRRDDAHRAARADRAHPPARHGLVPLGRGGRLRRRAALAAPAHPARAGEGGR
jgi:hypothetical protein